MDGRSKDVMKVLENIENEQSESGGPLLTPEEQMSKACGTRSGYIRGLGCGPRPSSRRGAEFREAYQREVEDLRGALERQQQKAEKQEQRLRLEAEEREHRLRLEAEEREHRLRIEAEKRECRSRLEVEEREQRIRSEMRSEICAEFQAQLQLIMAHIPGLQNMHSASSSDGHPISINTLYFILVNWEQRMAIIREQRMHIYFLPLSYLHHHYLVCYLYSYNLILSKWAALCKRLNAPCGFMINL